MNASWSRWLFGAWAAIAALWVLLAALMLIQTWPEQSVRFERGDVIGNRSDEAISDLAVRGNAGGASSAAAMDHVKKFLLFALLPPAFLLVLVMVALWVGGLPFPWLRRDRRDHLPNSRHG
jgi:hypothetical protein